MTKIEKIVRMIRELSIIEILLDDWRHTKTVAHRLSCLGSAELEKKLGIGRKNLKIMHICKYHLKDDKCYLKNICKVKHPKLQRYYQRISMHKLFCDQSGKIFWMIMDEWFGFHMIWQIPLILMGIISPPQPLAFACITHPLHLGVGVRGPTSCPIINIIVCLSLQAPPVYWKLHPGLCAPVLLQHTHYNKCNIATDYKVQKRGSVSQANFRLKFGIFL